MKKFPIYRQPEQMDCGPTCLRMIARHYGRQVSLDTLRGMAETSRLGSNMQQLGKAAEQIGFRSLGVKIDFQTLAEEAPLPCMVHWEHQHFIVVHKVRKGKVHVADPAKGLLVYPIDDFILHWIGPNAQADTPEGVAMLFEPTPQLRSGKAESETASQPGFRYLLSYLFRYRAFLLQLVLGLLVSSLIQVLFPFITQSVVDIGIMNRDLDFIYLLLFAQLALFLGRTSIYFIRSWILLHLSTRIRISLVSDFFIKLMKLPIAFFDTKMTGDILQRIGDHRRIERLLTITSLDMLFSLLNLVIFGGILAYYNLQIFLIFLGGSLVYVAWVLSFLKRRRQLDQQQFSQRSAEQNKVIELITGMQEIKLHNAEQQKRWSWEFIQAGLFKLDVKNLSLEQSQQLGASFINEGKNIGVTFLAAGLVVQGELSLGMMLSIAYITGQLNGPVSELVRFIHSLQDTRISLERLGEIHRRPEEHPVDADLLAEIDPGQDLVLRDLTYRYPGDPEPVLQGLDLRFPAGQTTAIVGASGSGKTTLMKLMLQFYPPESGEFWIGETSVADVAPAAWRNVCGAVLQEGFVFDDSIAGNIALGVREIDLARLQQAARIACIADFIEQLPLSYNTPIGTGGKGLSKGQEQRIRIARAVYKDPEILFFDEATSALDTVHEKQIMEHLQDFYRGKTVVLIAHRLSTVRHADQIVVLDQGRIVERGRHEDLVARGGAYFRLVREQLELEKLGT